MPNNRIPSHPDTVLSKSTGDVVPGGVATGGLLDKPAPTPFKEMRIATASEMQNRQELINRAEADIELIDAVTARLRERFRAG